MLRPDSHSRDSAIHAVKRKLFGHRFVLISKSDELNAAAHVGLALGDVAHLPCERAIVFSPREIGLGHAPQPPKPTAVDR